MVEFFATFLRVLHADGGGRVKSTLALVVLVLGWLSLCHTVAGELDHDELELVWYDEFEGSGVDWDKWIADEGDGCDVGLCDWGNSEKQYYLKENAHVGDGVLSITADKEEFSSRFYTSSKLTTKNRFSFRYGRVEARIKLPEGGQGLWPAFWMMPQDNAYGQWAASGEIDILESRNNITEVTNNLHFGDAYPNNTNLNGKCNLVLEEGDLQEFHTYALEWDEDQIVWLMDDNVTCTEDSWWATDVKTGTHKPKPAPFDQEFYLVLNVAVGGNGEYVGEGDVDDSALPATMMVEWVRVYQTPEQFGDGPTSPYLRSATGGGSRHGVMVWGDDFDDSTEMSPTWEAFDGDACLIGADRLCFSERQVFDTSQVSKGGGSLSIVTEAETTFTSDLGGEAVETASSGWVRTLGTFNFTYGRLEAKVSAPSVPGVVSSISLIPTSATRSGADEGQVDLVVIEDETVAGGLWFLLDNGVGVVTAENKTCVAPPSISDSHVSSASSSATYSYNFPDVNNTETVSSSASFSYKVSAHLGAGNATYGNSTSHYTYALEWTDERIRWYANGVQYCEATKSEVEEVGGVWPFDQEIYVAVGVAVGRDVFGNPVEVNASSLPSKLDVDSMHVHRFADMDGTPIQPSATKYKREANLTWQDEFDGVELDAASAAEAGEGVMGLEYWWQHEEGDGCDIGICGFGNGEAQWYTRDNTAVKDGKLIITAKAQPYAGNIYTSAKLSTNATVLVKYGRIETRVKLPSAQGLWPSIWMLPYDSPYGGWASGGAIDLLQSRNYMDRVHGQLVFGGEYPDVDNLDLYGGGHCYADELYGDFSEDYHVFAVEWEEEMFRWYVDDVLYCERSNWYSRPGPGEDDYPFPAPFDTEFYLIFNMAVGGSFTGGLIDEVALEEEAQMLVDYVRVYQFDGQTIEVAERPESEQRSPRGVDAITALAIGVALGFILMACLLVNYVAKQKSRAKGEGRLGGNESAFDSNGTEITKGSGSTPSKDHGGVSKSIVSMYRMKGPATTTNGLVAAMASTKKVRGNGNSHGLAGGNMGNPRPSSVPIWKPQCYSDLEESVEMRDRGRSVAPIGLRSDVMYSEDYHNSADEDLNRLPRPPSGVIPPDWIRGSSEEDSATRGNTEGNLSPVLSPVISPTSARSPRSGMASSVWSSGPYAARVAPYPSSSEDYSDAGDLPMVPGEAVGRGGRRSPGSRATMASSAWSSGPYAARVAHYPSTSTCDLASGSTRVDPAQKRVPSAGIRQPSLSSFGFGSGPAGRAPVPGDVDGTAFSPCSGVTAGSRRSNSGPVSMGSNSMAMNYTGRFHFGRLRDRRLRDSCLDVEISTVDDGDDGNGLFRGGDDERAQPQRRHSVQVARAAPAHGDLEMSGATVRRKSFDPSLPSYDELVVGNPSRDWS